MSNRTSTPHSIIPPYMLRRIIANGSEPQRNCAQTTLNHVNTLLAHPFAEPMIAPSTQGGEVERTIYDAHNGTALPGVQVRKEGQAATKDVAVNEAYDYLGVTYDFYWQAYKRNSLDNKGLALLGSVHYEKDYQNAFWNGQQMVFGDGDGEIFNRFTIAIDVIGHELTHGVTETEAGLIYFQQSGALNESMSDVLDPWSNSFTLSKLPNRRIGLSVKASWQKASTVLDCDLCRIRVPLTMTLYWAKILNPLAWRATCRPKTTTAECT